MKKIRDPVYGYIEIEDTIAYNIIDTATFQRLRNIIQTSYTPLYPASLHNRFVHSLGVFHLGKIAFASVYRSIEDHSKTSSGILNELKGLFTTSQWKRYRKLFEYACLLHDVGHAPFSHTGEVFYLKSKSRNNVKIKDYDIFRHLSHLTGDNYSLSDDGNRAPHEIMSCIVAMEEFGSLFRTKDERAFFARCITGKLYDEARKRDKTAYEELTVDEHNAVKRYGLLNCFIRLLNSTVIDVDRLDYLMRDAATTGYQSVSIDYERLLYGMVVVLEDDYNFTVGFHKNAVSIIENAVYAHDMERKWIQGHPVILYEMYLIRQTITFIEEEISKSEPAPESSLFSFDSLTKNGMSFKGHSIHYLGDEDLLYLMKNVFPSKYSTEFLNRIDRRLPVWKSEAEFKSLFSKSDLQVITEAMSDIFTASDGFQGVVVDENALSVVESEILQARNSHLENKAIKETRKKKYFEAVLNICEQYGIMKNILLLSTELFKSNFSKDEVGKIMILFPKHACKPLNEISTTLLSFSSNEKRFIYMFYYPKQRNEKIDTQAFAKSLVANFELCRQM